MIHFRTESACFITSLSLYLCVANTQYNLQKLNEPLQEKMPFIYAMFAGWKKVQKDVKLSELIALG